MIVGQTIETRGHITGFKEEIEKAYYNSKDEFYKWFNGSGTNVEATFVPGCWDFSYHIAQPVAKYIRDPKEKLGMAEDDGLLLQSPKLFKKQVRCYNPEIVEQQ